MITVSVEIQPQHKKIDNNISPFYSVLLDYFSELRDQYRDDCFKADLIIAELRLLEGPPSRVSIIIETEPRVCMVQLASGMDYWRVRPTTTTTTNDVAQHGGHPANTKSCSLGLQHISLILDIHINKR